MESSWLTDVQILRVLRGCLTLNPPFGCSSSFISLAGGRLICAAGGQHYSDLFLAYGKARRSAERRTFVQCPSLGNHARTHQNTSIHAINLKNYSCEPLMKQQQMRLTGSLWPNSFRFKSSCAADASAGWRGMVSQMSYQWCAQKDGFNL